MRERSERGYSESVQWAILLPVLMLALLGALQVGLWAHGRNTVINAAAAAAEAESAYPAAPGAGLQAANAIANAGGVSAVTVAVNRGANRVDVVVSGDMPLLIDLGMSRVSETATAPMERVQ